MNKDLGCGGHWWHCREVQFSSPLDVIEGLLPLVPSSNTAASLHTALPIAVWDTRCWRHLEHHAITPGKAVHSTITLTGRRATASMLNVRTLNVEPSDWSISPPRTLSSSRRYIGNRMIIDNTKRTPHSAPFVQARSTSAILIPSLSPPVSTALCPHKFRCVTRNVTGPITAPKTFSFCGCTGVLTI